MNLELITARMSQNSDAVRGLVSGVGKEQALWRQAPEKWSMVEIVCHLADEEREDFRTRLDLILHHPDQTWPGIDPEGEFRAKRYFPLETASSGCGTGSMHSSLLYLLDHLREEGIIPCAVVLL